MRPSEYAKGAIRRRDPGEPRRFARAQRNPEGRIHGRTAPVPPTHLRM